MATQLSLQMNKIFTLAGKNRTNEGPGKKTTVFGSFTTAAAAGSGSGPINIADVLILAGPIPTGARITGGTLTFGAMGASATAAIGSYRRNADGTFTAITAAKWLAATSVAAAGTLALATTDALSFGVEETEDVFVGAVAAGANFANAQTMKIALDYLALE